MNSASRYSDETTYRSALLLTVCVSLAATMVLALGLVLSVPRAPGVGYLGGTISPIVFFAGLICGFARGAAVRVVLTDSGVTIHNFWRNRFIQWDDFDEFLRTNSGHGGSTFSATLLTRSGNRLPMTAVQSRNYNVLLDRGDRESDQIVDRMNADAHRRMGKPKVIRDHAT